MTLRSAFQDTHAIARSGWQQIKTAFSDRLLNFPANLTDRRIVGTVIWSKVLGAVVKNPISWVS